MPCELQADGSRPVTRVAQQAILRPCHFNGQHIHDHVFVLYTDVAHQTTGAADNSQVAHPTVRTTHHHPTPSPTATRPREA